MHIAELLRSSLWSHLMKNKSGGVLVLVHVVLKIGAAGRVMGDRACTMHAAKYGVRLPNLWWMRWRMRPMALKIGYARECNSRH